MELNNLNFSPNILSLKSNKSNFSTLVRTPPHGWAPGGSASLFVEPPFFSSPSHSPGKKKKKKIFWYCHSHSFFIFLVLPFFYPLNLLNIMIITLDLTKVFRLPAVIPGATQPSGEQVCGHNTLIVFITIIIRSYRYHHRHCYHHQVCRSRLTSIVGSRTSSFRVPVPNHHHQVHK